MPLDLSNAESHLGAFVTLLGLVVGGRKAYLNRGIPMSKLPSLVRMLYDKLQNAQVDPDIIIGVSRGGLMLAGLVAEHYGKVPKKVTAYRREVIKNSEGFRVDIKIDDDWNTDVKGKTVLIVCAECNHGITLKHARDFALSKGAIDVKTLSLYVMRTSAFQPDFHCMELRQRPRLEWKEGVVDDTSGE